MQEFKHEYDLEKLQRITPTNHEFEMLVTPRYFDHYRRNSYEQFTADLILSRCRDDVLFIDIGSHYGFYTLLVGTRYKNAKIHAFDPVTENCEILKRNLELNNLSNVVVNNLAVSNKDETKLLHVTEAADSCGFYEHPNTSTVRFVEVKAVALDSFLNDIPNVTTVIKVDTEGHEISVLEGMKGILKEASDISLFVEFNPACLRSAGRRPEELLEEIDRLGFDIYFIEDEHRETYKISTVNFKNWTDYLGHQAYSNLFCRKKDQSLSVCFFSHSSRLAGAERILLELTGQLIRDYGVICTVVLPNEGPLKTRLEKVGASTMIGDYRWWCDLSSSSIENVRSNVLTSFKTLVADKLPKINKINPDIVFTVTMTIPWGAIVASTLCKSHVWFVTEFGVLDSNLKFVQPFAQILEIIKQASNLTLTLSDALRTQLFGNIGGG